MSEIRFRLGDSSSVNTGLLDQIYAVDPLLVSYETKSNIQAEILIIELPSDDSCRLFVPWNSERGTILLSTSSLPTSQDPFDFELEIARGTVGRLTEKFSNWNSGKFSVELVELVKKAQFHFREAIFLEEEPAVIASKCAVEVALDAIDLLCNEHTNLQSRPEPISYGLIDSAEFPSELEKPLDNLSSDDEKLAEEGTVSMNVSRWTSVKPEEVDLIAARVVSTPQFGNKLVCDAIDEVGHKTTLIAQNLNSQLEFETGIGPILNWRNQKIKDWFAGIQEFQLTRQDVYSLSQTIGAQLTDSFKRVLVATSIGASCRRFTDQEQLQLTLDAMFGINERRPDISLMVGFMHPIGGHVGTSKSVSPLHGADALMRAEVGLRNLALEISFSRVSRLYKRDLLQVEEMIDVWSQFKLPLTIIIELPRRIVDQLDQTSNHCPDGDEFFQLLNILKAQPEIENIFFTSALTPQVNSVRIPDDHFARKINQYLQQSAKATSCS